MLHLNLIYTKHAIILAHLNGRLVARQVHDFLLGQEELVERGVDHGLSSPHVVDRLRPNATNLAPVNHCFLSNFLTYILVAEYFFSSFIARKKFLFGVRNVLDHVT